MRLPLLAAFVVAVSSAQIFAEESDMVCLQTYDVALVEGVEETTVTFEYLPREVAEARAATKPDATRVTDLPQADPANRDERAACLAGLK